MATHLTPAKEALTIALCSANYANDFIDTLEGRKVITRRLGSSATPTVTDRWGQSETEGMEWNVIDEVVTLTNAVQTNLTNVIPAGAVIVSVQANLQTLVVGDGSGDDLGVKVGIGVTADPGKYGLSAALTKNTKIDWLPDWAVLGSNEQICVKLAKTDGTAATEKFTAGGQVRVRVVYLACNSLDDAA